MDNTAASARLAWATIVGVVPTVRQRSLQEAPEPDPVVYIPHVQNKTHRYGTWILVRSHADPGELTTLVRREIAALVPDLPLDYIYTMDQFLAEQRWTPRVFGTMFAVFAGIALVLAAVGLYAVTASSVAQRRKEIGVRMALGARPPQVWWLILRRGLLHLATGLLFGVAGSFAVDRLLRSLLVQTGSIDLFTLVSVTAFLAMIAITASFWPAWQASQIDPAVTLRAE